jgi:hypothetical protein
VLPFSRRPVPISLFWYVKFQQMTPSHTRTFRPIPITADNETMDDGGSGGGGNSRNLTANLDDNNDVADEEEFVEEINRKQYVYSVLLLQIFYFCCSM